MAGASKEELIRTVLAAGLVAGCGAPVTDGSVEPPVVNVAAEPSVSPAADLPDAREWCRDLVRDRAAFPKDASSLYNLGARLAFCGHSSLAKVALRRTVEHGPHHGAQLELALLAYNTEEASLDATIASIEDIIRDAGFRFPEGQLHVASLQMRRNGPRDDEEAKRNIQRAIAVEDDMPEAFAMLSQYFWWQGRQRISEGKPGRGMLVLAQRVATRSLVNHPQFGPLHHAHGLALWALGEGGAANQAFGRATLPQPRTKELVQAKSHPTADAELKRFRDQGESICRAGKSPACDAFAGVLENAAVLYERGGNMAKAIVVRRTLLGPAYNLGHTPEALEATLHIAKSYERLGIFDRAAGHFERFADALAKRPEAVDALRSAATYRYLLGDKAQGDALAQRFRRRYGRKATYTAPDLTSATRPRGTPPKLLEGHEIVAPRLD